MSFCGGRDGTSSSSQIDFSVLLSSALQDTAISRPQSLQFPWEQGIWKQVFAEPGLDLFDSAFEDPKPPEWVEDEVTTEAVVKRRKKEIDIPVTCVALRVVRGRHELTWEEEREAQMQRALARWIMLITKWSFGHPDLFICSVLDKCQNSEEQQSLLLDYFHNKAPATLQKRVSSLFAYHKCVGWDSDAFPCSEEYLYGHLCNARAGGAKASQMKALLEALVFVRYVLEIPELDPAIKSKRCRGAARRGKIKQREQGDPLRVKDLLFLHGVLKDGSSNLWDRCFAGACLACCYMRARWGDFQHTVSCELDHSDDGNVAYICFSAEIHKTSGTRYFDGRPIFWVAPSVGVTSDNWVEQWLTVRTELGLDAFKPPLPAPDSAGEATGSTVSTGELTDWLRETLPDREGLRTSAHVLKATFLSMAGKRGFAHLDCLALGAHAHGAGMAETYFREVSARPLRLLESMLREIRLGLFAPDASRVGRLDPSLEGFTGDAMARVHNNLVHGTDEHFPFPPEPPSELDVEKSSIREAGQSELGEGPVMGAGFHEDGNCSFDESALISGQDQQNLGGGVFDEPSSFKGWQ